MVKFKVNGAAGSVKLKKQVIQKFNNKGYVKG
jgi:hypothetical protein